MSRQPYLDTIVQLVESVGGVAAHSPRSRVDVVGYAQDGLPVGPWRKISS
jgi:hypothetical protein